MVYSVQYYLTKSGYLILSVTSGKIVKKMLIIKYYSKRNENKIDKLKCSYGNNSPLFYLFSIQGVKNSAKRPFRVGTARSQACGERLRPTL